MMIAITHDRIWELKNRMGLIQGLHPKAQEQLRHKQETGCRISGSMKNQEKKYIEGMTFIPYGFTPRIFPFGYLCTWDATYVPQYNLSSIINHGAFICHSRSTYNLLLWRKLGGSGYLLISVQIFFSTQRPNQDIYEVPATKQKLDKCLCCMNDWLITAHKNCYLR